MAIRVMKVYRYHMGSRCTRSVTCLIDLVSSFTSSEKGITDRPYECLLIIVAGFTKSVRPSSALKIPVNKAMYKE